MDPCRNSRSLSCGFLHTRKKNPKPISQYCIFTNTWKLQKEAPCMLYLHLKNSEAWHRATKIALFRRCSNSICKFILNLLLKMQKALTTQANLAVHSSSRLHSSHSTDVSKDSEKGQIMLMSKSEFFGSYSKC